MKVNDVKQLNELTEAYKWAREIQQTILSSGISTTWVKLGPDMLNRELREAIHKRVGQFKEELISKIVLLGVDDFTGWEK